MVTHRDGFHRWQIAIFFAAYAILCAPLAWAAPTSPLCDDGSYRRAHPLICDTGGPFTIGPVGGGGNTGGGGGLLDRIGDILGGRGLL